MERKIRLWLDEWKNTENPKPLVLTGPTMVGKTYETLEFAKTNYKNYIYVSLEFNPIVTNLLNKEMNMERLFNSLCVLYSVNSSKENTLIIFDNVDYYDKIINVLTRFHDAKGYHVISIANSVELPKNNTSYIEKVIFKKMNIITFEEYLNILGESKLVDSIINSYKKTRTNSNHDKICEYFKEYLVLGGFPSVIKEYIDTKDFNRVIMKQHEIYKNINSFLYKNYTGNYEKINNVIYSIPKQLFKENKKFQYGVIKKGARMSEYKEPIEYLKKNDFIIKCFKVNVINRTLSYSSDNNSFKLFLNDSGILASMYGIDYKNVLDKKWNKNLDAILNTYIATTLYNNGYLPYYYESEGKASVPFVIQTVKGEIIPIDIERRKKAKNITQFTKMNRSDYSINLSFNNFSKKGSIKNIPVYALFCL